MYDYLYLSVCTPLYRFISRLPGRILHVLHLPVRALGVELLL
ncbi:hypothetical protein DAQ1742_02919 [Dickeya aquatica]|uniref:Uncharacterized protein n=1 Tax=Dickeya aquatica TaxID=1401087 RepID=A0A375ACE6_9GAMM|nr:hypothetical protein DAQ1742_02919 [Dickeya aquatica]